MDLSAILKNKSLNLDFVGVISSKILKSHGHFKSSVETNPYMSFMVVIQVPNNHNCLP